MVSYLQSSILGAKLTIADTTPNGSLIGKNSNRGSVVNSPADQAPDTDPGNARSYSGTGALKLGVGYSQRNAHQSAYHCAFGGIGISGTGAITSKLFAIGRT
jgi:hypothetical protein